MRLKTVNKLKTHISISIKVLAFASALAIGMVGGAAYAADTSVEGIKDFSKTLSSMASHATQIIGRFFDGQNQANTELEFQRLTAHAHKDYQPSDLMCSFGTFTRSVARSEHKSQANAQLFNQLLTNNMTGNINSSAARGATIDQNIRIAYFKRAYCNISDNNNQLSSMCRDDAGDIGAQDQNRVNADIDYTRTIDVPLTLDMDITNDLEAGTAELDLSDTFYDVYMMARHLYWPEPIDWPNTNIAEQKKYVIQELRSLMSMNSVAQNSFTNFVADKTQSSSEIGADGGWNFMKAMMKSFNLSDDDIHQQLGDYPSYYAQMDVLTKSIYQTPDFYTNLYDTPTNVQRVSATLDALALMQMREQFDASMRQEMLLSTLLERRLRKPIRDTGALLKQ